jgi:hypothetical protein
VTVQKKRDRRKKQKTTNGMNPAAKTSGTGFDNIVGQEK